jgi:hypothetical protein
VYLIHSDLLLLDSFTNNNLEDNNSSSPLLASLEENDFSYPPNIDSKSDAGTCSSFFPNSNSRTIIPSSS